MNELLRRGGNRMEEAPSGVIDVVEPEAAEERVEQTINQLQQEIEGLQAKVRMEVPEKAVAEVVKQTIRLMQQTIEALRLAQVSDTTVPMEVPMALFELLNESMVADKSLLARVKQEQGPLVRKFEETLFSVDN